ncbi:MAG: FlgD immunoglobulin-like domain containing protein [Candidatus Eisenbacteria bacterium]
MLPPSHRIHPASIPMPVLLGLFCVSLLVLLPARVAHANNIILEWTAPGDDSTFGRATEYDMRYSLKANQFPGRFFSAVRVPLGAPSVANTVERLVLADMPQGANIYFALRTRDERGNWSRISNTLATQAVTGVEGETPRLDFSAPQPSPADRTTHFTLKLPSRTEVTVEVLDVTGRRVRELLRAELAAGEHDVAWDLKDEGGHLARAGVYFVRAKALGERFLRRVVVLR